MTTESPNFKPHDLLTLVQQRNSCRAYDPNREVDAETIRYCLEAARSAPSACNQQPWRFLIVQSPELRKRFYEDARLAGVAHEWWQQVPVFVVLCAQLSLVVHKIAPVLSGVPYWLLDLGIAGEHFVLAAEEQGLGSCWIGWFREKAVKEICAIPKSVKVAALITLGYPASAKLETGKTKRLNLDEIAFTDQWQHHFDSE